MHALNLLVVSGCMLLLRMSSIRPVMVWVSMRLRAVMTMASFVVMWFTSTLSTCSAECLLRVHAGLLSNSMLVPFVSTVSTVRWCRRFRSTLQGECLLRFVRLNLLSRVGMWVVRLLLVMLGPVVCSAMSILLAIARVRNRRCGPRNMRFMSFLMLSLLSALYVLVTVRSSADPLSLYLFISV